MVLLEASLHLFQQPRTPRVPGLSDMSISTLFKPRNLSPQLRHRTTAIYTKVWGVCLATKYKDQRSKIPPWRRLEYSRHSYCWLEREQDFEPQSLDEHCHGTTSVRSSKGPGWNDLISSNHENICILRPPQTGLLSVHHTAHIKPSLPLQKH